MDWIGLKQWDTHDTRVLFSNPSKANHWKQSSQPKAIKNTSMIRKLEKTWREPMRTPHLVIVIPYPSTLTVCPYFASRSSKEKPHPPKKGGETWNNIIWLRALGSPFPQRKDSTLPGPRHPPPKRLCGYRPWLLYIVFNVQQQDGWTSNCPWTPKPWKIKVLNPQYMGYNP